MVSPRLGAAALASYGVWQLSETDVVELAEAA
jgi:hypothetical protein